MQTINKVSANAVTAAQRAADRAVTTVTPHIQNMQKQINSTLETTKQMAEKGMAEGIKIGREMERSSTRAHEEYSKRPVVLVADNREIARLVSPMAEKAISNKMTGRK